MIVIVLTSCSAGLRGYLTRWLLEVSAGVFVGHVSARVRELMWAKCVEMIGTGRAILVRTARNEQRMELRVHGHHWEPVDVDGITLMLRPHAHTPGNTRALHEPPTQTPPKTGWSKAAKRRKFGGQ